MGLVDMVESLKLKVSKDDLSGAEDEAYLLYKNLKLMNEENA
jgi:hypothetical protein